MLLIVDEAHNLGLRLLEEVRMITNLVRDGQPRVRLVLAGGPKLEERFTSPKLESFNQRITARCYLHGFSGDETAGYVRSRIAAVGAQLDSVFTSDALGAVHQATDGIPRLVNQVCDHALVMAFAGGKHLIDAAGIEEAWADLQQLPGPWQTGPVASQDSAVVEFGALDDDAPTFDTTESAATVDQDFTAAPDEAPLVVTGAFDSFQPPAAAADSELDSVAETEAPAYQAAAEPTRDPFQETFEEEVVVVDRTTVRESIIFAGRPRVQSAEGQALAAALQNANTSYGDAHESAEVVVEPEVDEALADESPVATDAGADEGLVATSQMFEYTVFEPHNVSDLALQTLCEVNIAMGELDERAETEPEAPTVKLVEHRPTRQDDRSIIIVDADADKPAGGSSAAGSGSPHRVEYQELFAQLRHG
jgi:hypothetical protein